MHNSVRQVIETETNTMLEDYGDLIVQNIGAALLVPDEDLGGGDTLPIRETIADYDVMGDVDRYGADEAVLLSQKLRGLQVILGDSDNDPTNIEFDYTFGFESELVDRDRQERNRPTTNSTVVPKDEVNNDVLYHLSGNVSGQIEDTNGSGQALDYKTSSETNYLNEVGVLPEVSARENLHETVQFSTTTGEEVIDQQSIKFFSNWQLYWLETDEPLEGRQVDLFE